MESDVKHMDDLTMWRPVTPREAGQRREREEYLAVTPEEKEAALDGVLAALDNLADPL